MPKKDGKSLVFKVSYWNFQESYDKNKPNLTFQMGGLTKDHETVHVKVKDFSPYCYLELPKSIEWSTKKARCVYDYVKTLMQRMGPTAYEFGERYIIHYRKQVKCLTLYFPSHNCIKKFSELFATESKVITISDVGTKYAGEYKVHEQNIDPLIKFTALKELDLAGWIEIKNYKGSSGDGSDSEQEKMSTADIECIVDWSQVHKANVSNDVIVRPKYYSFDIECYSQNHNAKLPDPTNPKNKVICVAAVIGRYFDPKEERRRKIFTLGNPTKLDDVEIIKCVDERALLLALVSDIVEEDPDDFLGYNILKFDWNYLIERAKLHGIIKQFMAMGRLTDELATEKKITWSSSAYSTQVYAYPDVPGRLSVDALLEVERNYRMPIYTLSAVSQHFLKNDKEDLKPIHLFIMFKMSEHFQQYINKKSIVTPKELEEIQQYVLENIPIREAEDATPTTKYRDEILRATIKTDIKTLLRKPMTLICSYCVQDTVLVVDLIEKLNLRTSMEQMANIMNVPMSYLHTRGQQIKVLAQVYREVIFNDYIVPFHKKDLDDETIDEEKAAAESSDEEEEDDGEDKEYNPFAKKKKKNTKYQGATVIEAHEGYYENVVTLDFASLYPSMIIAYNICFTTIVDPKDPIPDSECNVLEWTDHVGCAHDPQKRKKAKDRILCQTNRHRFKRVKVDKDGKLINIGLMPQILLKLLASRKAVKKEMAVAEAMLKMDAGKADASDLDEYKNKLKIQIIEKGSLSKTERNKWTVVYNVLDAKQKAIKISANSAYGGMGAVTGYLFFLEGASSVTAMGRKSIHAAIDYVAASYINSQLVYGDSVSHDTPILCRHNDKVFYRSIEDVPVLNNRWIEKGTKLMGEPLEGFEVWSDKGFTRLKRVIKHKTDKQMYRVLTHTGFVTVTEDHSLLDEKAREVQPKNVKVGDLLLHNDLPLIDGENVIACAYSRGLFYGDGSCGNYRCPSGIKYSWAINNQDLDVLGRAKKELNEYYNVVGISFHIHDTMESSSVYKLIARGDVKALVMSWRKQFYDNRKFKKVPDSLFSSDISSRKLFFEGYYAADGDKDKCGYVRFDNKGQIGAAGLYILANSLGYPVSINIRKDKENIFRLTATRDGKKQRKHGEKVKKIEQIGKTDEYVYDLETENHHFAAGVGRLVVHNTDSCMIIFKGATLKESFTKGKEVSKRVSHYLKCKCIGVDEKEKLDEKQQKLYEAVPIDLSFETLYKKYLLLTKKRYIAHSANEKGEVVKVVEKGVVLVRRDNCTFLKDSYRTLVNTIMNGQTEAQFIDAMNDCIHKLFTRQVHPSKLVIYKAVKGLLDYAMKDPKKKYYLDENKQPFDDPIGPTDSRLVYRNLGQVSLALKMTRRGDIVPPNTRLEYLFLENEHAQYEGDYMEDYSYYIDNRMIKNLRPDYVHYLEKQFMNPVQELISIRFVKREIPFCKVEDAVLEEIKKLPLDLRTDIGKKRGTDAKVKYILEKVSKKKYPKVINAARNYHAKNVLDKLYKYYGLKKKIERKPLRGKKIYENMNMLKNIIAYRECYRNVVKHLKQLFSRYKIIKNK